MEKETLEDQLKEIQLGDPIEISYGGGLIMDGTKLLRYYHSSELDLSGELDPAILVYDRETGKPVGYERTETVRLKDISAIRKLE